MPAELFVVRKVEGGASKGGLEGLERVRREGSQGSVRG